MEQGLEAPRRRITDDILLWLFHTFPAKTSIFKAPGSRARGEYESELSAPLCHWFGRGPEMFAGKDVLDLGSGYGGRTVRLAELGASSVTGLEITAEKVTYAEEFARERGVHNVRFLVGTGERIPCDDAQFDLITMFDVLEHVVCPRDVLRECWRVLRPGGSVALVFPPYYDFSSGSHLHGYATSVPGLNLIFSTAALKSAARRLFEEQGIEWWNWLRPNVPTDKLWNQNGLTIRQFNDLLDDRDWTVHMLRHCGHCDYRWSRHRGLARWLRMPLYLTFMLPAHLPLVQEILTVRVVAVLGKPMMRRT